MLGVDVRRAEAACHLVGVEQQSLRGSGEGRGLLVEGLARLGQTALGGRGDVLGLGAGAADRVGARLLLREKVQDVQGVDIAVALLHGVVRGLGQHLVSASAEQPRDVNGAPGLRLALAL